MEFVAVSKSALSVGLQAVLTRPIPAVVSLFDVMNGMASHRVAPHFPFGLC